MIESEGYPDGSTYTDRTLRSFEPGEHVKVGPAYRMGGSYVADEHCGEWTVRRRLNVEGCRDYYLLRGWLTRDELEAAEAIDQWHVICHASRLMRAIPRIRASQARSDEAQERIDLALSFFSCQTLRGTV